VTPDAIVAPEGNETSRRLLRNYYLMLQYVCELVRQCGDEQDLERWRRILNVA